MGIREGQTFGNYQVLARLGAGGMGAVYLAEHPLIGKKVALKVIHQDLATNREVVSRFFNEARAVNQIGSEHIIQINDFGQTAEGDHFFVMEYIEGRTLAELLAEEGALHPQRALHIAAQIADALGAAHACAIIHRDLKPDNIMLVQRLGDPDFVKVLDFGLAKMLGEPGSGGKLTVQGVVLGTPQYMAPEVCESSKDLDHRVDIYSLGVLLFQMATGRLPFDGASMGSILMQHVTEPPPAPRGINPAVPPSVEQVILRCLAKSPDARFASMEEARQAFLDPERYLAGGPPVMPSASPAAVAGRTAPGNGQPPPWSGASMSSAPLNQTMSIETPVGYRAAPPRRRWPLVLALSVAAATAGAAGVSLVLAPSKQGPAPSEHMAEHMAAGVLEDEHHDPALADGGAAAAVRPALEAAAAPRVADTVTLRLVTRPSGARVFDIHDHLLGETPAEISLPRGTTEHVLVFRHPRAKERRKTVLATGDAAIELELELVDARSEGLERRRRERRRRPREPDRGQLDQEIDELGRDQEIMAPDF